MSLQDTIPVQEKYRAIIPSTPAKDSACFTALDLSNIKIVQSSANKCTYRIGINNITDDKDVVKQDNSKFAGPVVERVSRSVCSTDLDNLSNSLNVLIDFCTLYGYSSVKFKRESTLAHWQRCSMQSGWIAFMKYKLSAFMSHKLNNELPPCPFTEQDWPHLLAGGSLGRFISKVMRSRQALGFAVGILYLKKGLPRPSAALCEQSKLATKKVLTTKQDLPISSLRPRVRDYIRRITRSVFRSQITEKDLHHPYAPSIKANYVDSRSKFGTFGTLVDLGLLSDEKIDLEGSSLSRLPESIFRDCLVADKSEEEIESEDLRRYIVNPLLREKVASIYREAYNKCRTLAVEEVANVKLVSFAEALKVRTISKGPPLTYFTLKPVQKFLHNAMRRHRLFHLLGEPDVKPKFLQEVFSQSEGQFHSLDYKSATDLLDPEVSKWCVDEICDSVGMPSDLRLLFHKALTGHMVEGEQQLWGQLMGSVVSFIVLCIVNAAVCWYSYEISVGRSVSLENLPIIVNGDDGLVRASESFLSTWKEISSCIGLIPSVGKTYSHSTYCNINSTSFNYNEGVFELISYVNMGLVYGLGRSSTSSVGDIVDPTLSSATIGARHEALITNCPKGLRLQVHELFLKHNSKTLKSTTLPWYIPGSLGGIGLSPLLYEKFPEDVDDDVIRSYYTTSSGHKCGPSRMDVMIANSLRDKVHKSFSCRKIPTLQPIQARIIWQRAFHENDRNAIEVEDSQSGFLDLSTYYLIPTQVMKSTTLEESIAVLRHNERAWSFLSSAMGDLPEGADLFMVDG